MSADPYDIKIAELEEKYNEFERRIADYGLSKDIKYFRNLGAFCLFNNNMWHLLMTDHMENPKDSKIALIYLNRAHGCVVIDYGNWQTVLSTPTGMTNLYGAMVQTVRESEFIINYDENNEPVKYKVSNNLFHYADDQQTDIYFDAKTDKTYRFTKKQYYLVEKIKEEEICKIKQVHIINCMVFIGENVYIEDNAIMIDGKAHYLVYWLHKHYILEYETGSLSLKDGINRYFIKCTKADDKLYFNELWISANLQRYGFYGIYLIEGIYILREHKYEDNTNTFIEVFPNNIAEPMHTKAAIRLAEPVDD